MFCSFHDSPFQLAFSLVGKDKDGSCAEQISSAARAVDELIDGMSKDGSLSLGLRLPCLQSVVAARDELQAALQCLHSWKRQAGESARSSAASEKSADEENSGTHVAVASRVVSKAVYTLPAGATFAGNTHWVWWTSLCVTGLDFKVCSRGGLAANIQNAFECHRMCKNTPLTWSVHSSSDRLDSSHAASYSFQKINIFFYK